MNDFALVTEGVTDQAILKNILIGYFKDQHEPVVYPEHPDPQSKAKYGGWTLLIQYLRERKFRQAFQLNRYLIVQIDTDVSADVGFDVPWPDENDPLFEKKLIEQVIARLQVEIGVEDWIKYGEKFIFAIAVHQTECWVLPLWYDDKAHAEKITGCIGSLGHCDALRSILNEKNLRWIRSEEKDLRSYEEASRGYRKTKVLHEKGRKNPSLNLFLDHLDQKNIDLLPEE